MNLTQPTIPISLIVQGKNPRTYFDPVEMENLEDGLRAAGGIIEPIIVRKVPDSERYEIIAGERRWRAALNVFGKGYEMPIVLREVTDAGALSIAVIENHCREGMSVMDEARAAKRQLMRLHGDKTETAREFGWSPDVLNRRLALLTCSAAVQDALTQKKIQLGHAELLAGVPPEKQDDVLAAILAHNVTVTVLKGQLGKFSRLLCEAVFDTAQCAGCLHNSAQQAGLFDETLGDGYCQHPTHYDELTMQAVEAKAESLREQYPTVHIVKANDAVTPLPLSGDGELGVGEAQFNQCKGCGKFGCAVSALPGSYGEVTHSLCFDAACNSQKVAAWHQAQSTGIKADETHGSGQSRNSGNKAPTPKPTNQTSQRIVDFRLTQWRKWAVRALMGEPERNSRVLLALVSAGQIGKVHSKTFAQAAQKLAGWEGQMGFRQALQEANGLAEEKASKLTLAIAASAAFGIDESHLTTLLNFLEIDEQDYFIWNEEFLELHTVSELEALAKEVGLVKAMGVLYQNAAKKKKTGFIKALLSVSGFDYATAVPAVMRYPRIPFTGTGGKDMSEASNDGALPDAGNTPQLAA